MFTKNFSDFSLCELCVKFEFRKSIVYIGITFCQFSFRVNFKLPDATYKNTKLVLYKVLCPLSKHFVNTLYNESVHLPRCSGVRACCRGQSDLLYIVKHHYKEAEVVEWRIQIVILFFKYKIIESLVHLLFPNIICNTIWSIEAKMGSSQNWAIDTVIRH